MKLWIVGTAHLDRLPTREATRSQVRQTRIHVT